jgi:hypothetical protein
MQQRKDLYHCEHVAAQAVSWRARLSAGYPTLREVSFCMRSAWFVSRCPFSPINCVLAFAWSVVEYLLMPHYFVDLLRGGEMSVDEQGMELADMAAIRQEVETTIRQIAADSIRAGSDSDIGDGEIRVRDMQGKTVLTVKFHDVIG